MSKPWEAYIGDDDRAVMSRAKFGRRMGFGKRPALIAIDCQRYMVGERNGANADQWPSSCGAIGWAAVDQINSLVKAARHSHIPVFFTRFELSADGSDIGVYGRKRDLLNSEHWCLENTVGSQILPELGPELGDMVFVKKKPSGFFGTPLLTYLVDRQIDTVIIVGGATSNCIRATVFDASSYNFRTIVPADAVFDRIQVSHAISLFDMDRQFADVLDAAAVLEYFNSCDKGGITS